MDVDPFAVYQDRGAMKESSSAGLGETEERSHPQRRGSRLEAWGGGKGGIILYFAFFWTLQDSAEPLITCFSLFQYLHGIFVFHLHCCLQQP